MKTRLLIIEDDAAIAQLHHRYLSQLEGFEVVGIAMSQADARLQMEVLNPDLVLLDVYLPDGTGLELLQWIRGRNVHCDVILITAAREVETHSSEALPQRLPKGIDAVTLDKIRLLFQTATMLTADEAGEKIGASRTTARRYLEYLITAGELEADLSYGTVGRPERTYRKLHRHTS